MAVLFHSIYFHFSYDIQYFNDIDLGIIYQQPLVRQIEELFISSLYNRFSSFDNFDMILYAKKYVRL